MAPVCFYQDEREPTMGSHLEVSRAFGGQPVLPHRPSGCLAWRTNLVIAESLLRAGRATEISGRYAA
jgi:hypothetical protein